jgi:hypothetical protein
VLSGFLGTCVCVGAIGAGRRRSASSTSGRAEVPAMASPTSSATGGVKIVSLPAEPAPPDADQAREVPALEAKLAADAAYKAVWNGPRPDLNLFLTSVSELLAEGSASVDVSKPLDAKKLKGAATTLHHIHTRVGRFPEDFTKRVLDHLDAVRSEPELGVWSPKTPGQAPHDFAALAAWMRQEDPAYLRALLRARRDGPLGWRLDPRAHDPLRPWLVDPFEAVERLKLLTPLTDEDCHAIDRELYTPKAGKVTGRCDLPRDRHVTAVQFGLRWPLKVRSGHVMCRPPNVALFEDDGGTLYSINGACVPPNKEPACDKLVAQKIDPIWQDDPRHRDLGMKISIQWLLSETMSLCEP